MLRRASPLPLPHSQAAILPTTPSSRPGRHVTTLLHRHPSTTETTHGLPALPAASNPYRPAGLAGEAHRGSARGCRSGAGAEAVPARAVLGAEPWRHRGVFPAGASGRVAPGPERWERRAPWKRTETVRERRRRQREDAEPRAAVAAGARVPG